ncbi:MAG: hypothetical protein NZ811_02670 [Gammaproteobacteria bacterium]|nr:hypothetical protein [Gammaproteobacteria bacterium]
MASVIGTIALLLLSSVNLEMMIAGNNRRLNQAKISATSGVSHFVALNLRYDTLRRRAGDLETLQVIPETQLSSQTFYDVKIHFCCGISDRQYLLESIGYFKKNGKVISQYPIRALFQGEE